MILNYFKDQKVPTSMYATQTFLYYKKTYHALTTIFLCDNKSCDNDVFRFFAIL